MLRVRPAPDPAKTEVLYHQVSVAGFQSMSRGVYYTVNACLVTPVENGIKSLNKLRVVFTCECPSFRFSKGEWQDGKTCKHIDRFCWARSQETAYSEIRARLVARRVIERTRRFTISDNYRFRA